MIKQMDKILLINLGKTNMAILCTVFMTFKLFLNKNLQVRFALRKCVLPGNGGTCL